MSKGFNRRGEKGSSTAEFAVVALIFFMVIIGIIEFGRLLYTHNALTDATRRGARFAVTHEGTSSSSETDAKRVAVKNYVVYGANPTFAEDGVTVTSPALINGLTPAMVKVEWVGMDKDGDGDIDTNFGSNLGSATVRIEGYQFSLSLPLLNRPVTMPGYATTLIAESAGEIPDDITP